MSNLPKWLVEGSEGRDKNIVCDSFDLYALNGQSKLIQQSELKLSFGHKYGLIGKNGSGKSTLLERVYQCNHPMFPDFLRIVYMKQNNSASQFANEISVLESVIQSDTKKAILENEEQRLLSILETSQTDQFCNVDAQLETVYEWMDSTESHKAEYKASQILSGLGFTRQMQIGSLHNLSGGWRQRVFLAQSLFIDSDLLLLDEPTNHLDFPAIEWLKQHLQLFPGTLVVVSHDISFLDAVCSDIIELEHKKLTYYKGGYKNHKLIKDEKLKSESHAAKVQQKRIDSLKTFVEEAKQSTNQATVQCGKARQKVLQKIQHEVQIQESQDHIDQPRKLNYWFACPGKLDHALLNITDMKFAYNLEDAPVITKANLALSTEFSSKIGLLGQNGSGKSTLINLILGHVRPSSGICKLNAHARTAVFTQHHTDQLDVNKTALEWMLHSFPKMKEDKARGCLGRFGLDKRSIERKISTLSGGQKSRVAFATMTSNDPHLIIADEITNHLDIETKEAMVEAFNQFTGAAIIVSHDQWFLESVANEFWAISASSGELVSFFDIEEAKRFAYD